MGNSGYNSVIKKTQAYTVRKHYIKFQIAKQQTSFSLNSAVKALKGFARIWRIIETQHEL